MKLPNNRSKKRMTTPRLLALLSAPAILSVSFSSFALSSYVTKVNNYCSSMGMMVATPVTCSTCHSGSPETVANANTALASQYKAGNYAAFCKAVTPTPTPTPTPRRSRRS